MTCQRCRYSGMETSYIQGMEFRPQLSDSICLLVEVMEAFLQKELSLLFPGSKRCEFLGIKHVLVKNRISLLQPVSKSAFGNFDRVGELLTGRVLLPHQLAELLPAQPIYPCSPSSPDRRQDSVGPLPHQAFRLSQPCQRFPHL